MSASSYRKRQSPTSVVAAAASLTSIPPLVKHEYGYGTDTDGGNNYNDGACDAIKRECYDADTPTKQQCNGSSNHPSDTNRVKQEDVGVSGEYCNDKPASGTACPLIKKEDTKSSLDAAFTTIKKEGTCKELNYDSDDESRFSDISNPEGYNHIRECTNNQCTVEFGCDVLSSENVDEVCLHSDDVSRFSYMSNTSPIKKGAINTQTTILQSCLITREQLHYLTGGKNGGYKNPLRVGTPMNYCGGPALATSKGKVHHICIKEEMNHPLPKSLDEEFLLYRRTKSGAGPLVRDVQLLVDLKSNHPPIPIFWEPSDQDGTKVQYFGHWKVTTIEDYSSDPIIYMEYLRCAMVKFEFVVFDQRWASIIKHCHDKSSDEIKSIIWNDFDDKGGTCFP